MVVKISSFAVGPPVVKKRDEKKILREVMGDIGEEWHKKYRTPHFTQSAYSRYNYTPRSKKYNRAKRKHVGHTLPLVLSGVSRNLSEQKQVLPTPRRVRVRMPVRVFNFKTTNSRVNKSQEFRTVADFETKALNRQGIKGVDKRLRQIKRKTRLL